jgi:tRNA(fMet)-specific endonuclease VapC
MDMLIGAHALSLEVTLVTNNVKEFRQIKDLIVANWTI